MGEAITYTFNQHKHNYAVWTAARAVQRSFAPTKKIKTAIEGSGLREYAEGAFNGDLKSFESFHKSCSHKLIKAFKKLGLGDVSYGRVAKIISIYLKTSVIICSNGETSQSNIIHPPIDSILLTRISKLKGLRELKTIRWTKLDEKKYWELVSKLRDHFDKFDWTIEEYWIPE
jgi:hypothetical protein